MKINIHKNKKETSKEAALQVASILNETIHQKGTATFIIATGVSQLDFIDALISEGNVDWSKTKMFHLDEYINLPETHPASFRKYLKERFISKVNKLKEINLINGEADDPREECNRLNRIIKNEIIDVAFVGIGENGHLAFNDPPADFEIEDPYIIVNLDEHCRKQQVGEGWFDSIEDVPQQAISMSIKQIMKSKNIICTIPGERKAQAVKDCFGTDKISPIYPSSILKKHKNCFVFLDFDSAKYLSKISSDKT
ncbi:glucosamine-6-phosphate deaminase [Candidatus Atribacteria bacterium HGW-Atribacteria-1]|nr:MAG: glucosamine-6-phosphate deaminase [Candidatus Atribacteria bacterium HGW-Atribacteria-1]